MDLARVAEPLRVALRLAFVVVVGAAALVDVWLIREYWVFGSLTRPLVGIAAIAGCGVAWALWPWAAMSIAVSASVLTLAGVDDASVRGLPVGVFTQFAVMPVLLAAVLVQPTRWRWPVAALVVVAAESVAVRGDETAVRTIIAMTMLVLLGVAAAAVAYMHLRDNERRASIEHARQNERLDLARELHDIVGHHVTGIVVLAQASRFTGGAPAGSQADHALADIEAAGIETLTSIRRLVGVLRTDPATTAGPRLADIEHIVDGLRSTHPSTALVVGERLRSAWVPPDLAMTIQRLVQEAATNVRRHGDPAAPVTFSLTTAGGDVDLVVENRVARSIAGTGYGLIGMRERVESLGGTFTAGQVGGVWRVHVTLPMLHATR